MKKVRRKKMQVREKVGKSRNTVFFRCFVAPKAAGAETSGQMRDEKLHAVVARSTFRPFLSLSFPFHFPFLSLSFPFPFISINFPYPFFSVPCPFPWLEMSIHDMAKRWTPKN